MLSLFILQKNILNRLLKSTKNRLYNVSKDLLGTTNALLNLISDLMAR